MDPLWIYWTPSYTTLDDFPGRRNGDMGNSNGLIAGAGPSQNLHYNHGRHQHVLESDPVLSIEEFPSFSSASYYGGIRTFPNAVEQQALMSLTRHPDHILAGWFALARHGPMDETSTIDFRSSVNSPTLSYSGESTFPSLTPQTPVPVIHELTNSSAKLSSNGSRSSSQSTPKPGNLGRSQHRTKHSKKQSDRIRYSCTFCSSPSTFKSKNEWKRHERSHVPQVEYTCLPVGAVIFHDNSPACAICGFLEPCQDHLVHHKMHLCIYKPVAGRTFHRRDKFAKHLQVHGLTLESPQVARWSRPRNERRLGCGFCVKNFATFEERSQHVACHFEQGRRREGWSQSTVINSLLTQPSVRTHWDSLLDTSSNSANVSCISWPPSSSTDALQHRLEDAVTDGCELAIMAYNLSSLCSTTIEYSGNREGQKRFGDSANDAGSNAMLVNLYGIDSNTDFK